MQVGHHETAGIAKQIAVTADIVTQHLRDAIAMINRPGASIPSTREAVVQIAAAFAEAATLQVSQVVQAEMLVAGIDGGTLEDVKENLVEGLLETTATMSDPTAIGEDGIRFPVGALSRHFQEQLASSYSQAILSVKNIIESQEKLDDIKEFIFGLDADIILVDPELRSPLFTAQGGGSPRAG